MVSIRISKWNKLLSSVDSNRLNMFKINLSEVRLNKIRRLTIIRFVIACSLPRVILPSSKDRLLLGNSMLIKDNNQFHSKLSDSLYLKLIQWFTTRRRCNRFHLATLRQWELMNISLGKRCSWLKTRPILYNLCSNLVPNSNLDSRMVLLRIWIKGREMCMLEDNHLSTDKVSIQMYNLV